MKLKTFLAAAAACVFALASCSKDVETIEGEYIGFNKSTPVEKPNMPKQMPGGGDKEPTPVAFVVADYVDGLCTISIPGAHPCILEGCKVTVSNGVYSIHHDGKNIKPANEETGEHEYYSLPKGFDATIKGDTFKTEYNMIVKAMAEFMPKGLNYSFEGTRK